MAPTKEQLDYASNTKLLKTEEPEIPQPRLNFNPFFKQRRRHRMFLFWFSLITSLFSLVALVAVIGLQIYFRATIDPEFEVMSEHALQIIAVAIFGQVFGVVYVIAHAIWSNHEFRLMENGKR